MTELERLKTQYKVAMYFSGDGENDVALVNEDDIPEMTNEEYNEWFKESSIIDGVRMGKPFVE